MSWDVFTNELCQAAPRDLSARCIATCTVTSVSLRRPAVAAIDCHVSFVRTSLALQVRRFLF
jgi:hypothetical protein